MILLPLHLPYENYERKSTAIQLAIRLKFHPLDPDDTIPRKDIISMKKLIAEGKLEEQ
jgi:hypothetical protein